MRRLAILVIALALDTPFFVRNSYAQGVITTVAGSTWVFRANGAPAVQAPIGPVTRLAVGASGNLYLADTENHLAQKISPSGILTILAGNGIPSVSGDGGIATRASVYFPRDVAVDAAGNVYVVHVNRIRKVSPSGIITTIAGTGTASFSGDGGPATSASLNAPRGLVVDPGGNVYFADTGNNRVRVISPGGTIVTVAATGRPACPGMAVRR